MRVGLAVDEDASDNKKRSRLRIGGEALKRKGASRVIPKELRRGKGRKGETGSRGKVTFIQNSRT